MNEAEEERIRPGDVKFWETWEVFESPHFRMFPFSNVRELKELSMYNYKSWDAFFSPVFHSDDAVWPGGELGELPKGC